MSREAHVRFWEHAGVKVPRVTRLPLYRQHQRLGDHGIVVSRSSLNTWASRAIDLLEPIFQAQNANVLQSRVLAMDETSGPNFVRASHRRGACSTC